MILNHPLFQRFENIPFIVCNSGKHRGCCILPTFRPYGSTHIASLRVYPHSVPTGLRKTTGPVFSTHIPSLRDSGKQRGRCFLPTFRPYGTTGNTGVVVFYPPRVPTGLPIFRPYGTTENTGPGVFYLHRVPTGLWKTPAPVFSTHLASLRDSGKHQGCCFLLD
jgi:hypothetical protein